jgi:predicted kinase
MGGTRPLFILLVGLPGSGKTTLAKKLREKAHFHTASTDDYLQEIADADGVTYDDVWNKDTANTAEAHMWSKVKSAFATGVNVLWDQTNLSVRKRRKVLAAVPSNYMRVCAVLRCDDHERQRRLMNREGKTIPQSVDDAMITSFLANTPTTEEGFHAIVDGADL